MDPSDAHEKLELLVRNVVAPDLDRVAHEARFDIDQVAAEVEALRKEVRRLSGRVAKGRAKGDNRSAG